MDSASHTPALLTCCSLPALSPRNGGSRPTSCLPGQSVESTRFLSAGSHRQVSCHPYQWGSARAGAEGSRPHPGHAGAKAIATAPC